MITPQNLANSRVLVDTDVFSFLMKEDTRGEWFKPFLHHKTAVLCFVTVAELYYWAYKRSWGASRITVLENHLKNYVVLPYDYELCLRWATVRRDSENAGQSIEHSDCWIAATALRHGCALATNNGKHFAHVKGLALISPSLT